MFTFLVVLISIIAVLLIVVILLQSGKGGGLAATFGGASSSTESIIGGRQAANLLTRLTWIGGGVFLFLALILAILSTQTGEAPRSILRGQFGPEAGQPASPTSVLESELEGENPPGEETQPLPAGAGTPAGQGVDEGGEAGAGETGGGRTGGPGGTGAGEGGGGG